MYYKYTQKWVSLFLQYLYMLPVETSHYIKDIHNLLNALFDLRHYQKFKTVLREFESFSESEVANSNQKALSIVPQIKEKLEDYALCLDRHRVLVFYYKIASLYFGSGDYETCIDYVQKIIY